MRHCGKSAVSFASDRQHRFVLRVHAENDFVLGIIQTAETGQIFTGVRIEPANRLQNADRRQKRRVRRADRTSEIAPRAIDRDEVINERYGRNRKEDIA